MIPDMKSNFKDSLMLSDTDASGYCSLSLEQPIP